MKLGISLAGFPLGTETAQLGPLLSRLARRADEADFDSLWTMDHFFQIPITGQPPEAAVIEAYAVLAFLAAETRRIRLGTMVTCVAYRHPGVLIKAVTSIGVLSGGRLIFGVGAGAPFSQLPAGRSPRDFEAYGLGLPFPPLAERLERLEEVMQIALQIEVLRTHCDDVGRDYGATEKTVSTFIDPAEDRSRITDHLAELAALGIDHAMVSPRPPWDAATLDLVASIIPDLHAIRVAG